MGTALLARLSNFGGSGGGGIHEVAIPWERGRGAFSLADAADEGSAVGAAGGLAGWKVGSKMKIPFPTVGGPEPWKRRTPP